MNHLSHVFLTAGAAVALALTVQGQASARSVTASRAFSTPQGTVTETVTRSYAPSTGVAARAETVTRPDGQSATVSATSTPDGRGGFIDTRSVKTFSGQTQTTTRQIGR